MGEPIARGDQRTESPLVVLCPAMGRLLALPLVVLAMLLAWAAAPALSSTPWRPVVQDFSLDLPVTADARAAGRGWRSPAIRAPRRFDLVGLRWTRASELEGEVRSRRGRGEWSRWVRLPIHGDHAPDGSGPPSGTEPC